MIIGKRFVVANCGEGMTWPNSEQNSKIQNFDDKKYIKRIGFLC